MARKGLPEKRGESVPNLAPMVDIIMCLLIYFMLGASMHMDTEGVLQTELDPRSGPSAGDSVQITPVIRIGLQDVDQGAGCAIAVLDESFGGDFEELRNFLAQRRAAGADTTNPVVIGADGTVRYRYIIRAFDACVRAGFKNVQFAVSFAPAGGETK